MHSPFEVSENKSEDGNTTYKFDVVEKRKPSRLFELNVVQSDNITIQNKTIPPLCIAVSKNVNITYSVRTILVSDGISILYEKNGTQYNWHKNDTNASGKVFGD